MTEPSSLAPQQPVTEALTAFAEEVGQRVLSLASLADGTPGITPVFGELMAEAASVCLSERGHGLSVTLTVKGDFVRSYGLVRSEVDERMRATYADEQVTTENGAYGIAILALRDLTGLTVVRRSRKGTGFDFWLAREDDFLFRDAARLEVSGIRQGALSAVHGRLRVKREQTRKSDGSLPAFVTVIEFGAPAMEVEQR